MRQPPSALVLSTVGVRWPAVGLAFVLLDIACFPGLGVFAMDHFVWMSANIGVLIFGPVIWTEHHRFRRRGASFTRRQPKTEPLTRALKAEEERERERRRLDELRCEAKRQREAGRQRQAEQQGEATRRRKEEKEEGEREAEGLCQRERRQATAQSQREWWRILEVAPGASKEEIVHKYRRKVQQCHPDRVAGLAPEFLQLAEERTKALNQAYEQALRYESRSASAFAVKNP